MRATSGRVEQNEVRAKRDALAEQKVRRVDEEAGCVDCAGSERQPEHGGGVQAPAEDARVSDWELGAEHAGAAAGGPPPKHDGPDVRADGGTHSETQPIFKPLRTPAEFLRPAHRVHESHAHHRQVPSVRH